MICVRLQLINGCEKVDPHPSQDRSRCDHERGNQKTKNRPLPAATGLRAKTPKSGCADSQHCIHSRKPDSGESPCSMCSILSDERCHRVVWCFHSSCSVPKRSLHETIL